MRVEVGVEVGAPFAEGRTRAGAGVFGVRGYERPALDGPKNSISAMATCFLPLAP